MTRSRRIRLRFAPLVFATMLSVSAGPPETSEDFLRLGLTALDEGKLETALAHFAKAAERTTDPGLIAFNQAVAYERLFKNDEAERHYLMVLDDATIPKQRQAKAFYNRGNSLVRLARPEDEPLFRVAITCYERCLESDPAGDLRANALYNLELAKLLWNQARAQSVRKPTPNTDEPQDQQPSPPTKKKDTAKIDETTEPSKSVESKKEKLTPVENVGPNKVEIDKEPKEGKLAPRTDPARAPLADDQRDFDADSDSKDPWKIVEETAERLQNERRQQRKLRAILEIPSGKDW